MLSTNPVEPPPGLQKKTWRMLENRWKVLEDPVDDHPRDEDANQRQQDLKEMEFPKLSLGNYSKNQVRKRTEPKAEKGVPEQAQKPMVKSAAGGGQLNLFYPQEVLQELHPCINAENAVGGWKFIKGVMDSGATDSVIHPSECADYEIQESAGSKAGQKWTSASGGVIPNLGQKILEVLTEDGVESRMKYQAADVSRTLNSITEICDAGGEEGQYVIFSKWGGTVYNPSSQRQTPFEREGGIYTMGMWVKPKSGFTRPAE